MPAPRPQCVVRGSATAASTSWLTMSAARSGRSPMRSTLRLRSRRRSAACFSQRSGAAVLRFRQCWDHGAGVIINVSSIATRSVNRVPYAAAKGGVTTITASLAMEYAAHGIRVCGVAPGGTEAPPRRIPAQRRRAERPGERMDPSGRGPDGLVERCSATRYRAQTPSAAGNRADIRTSAGAEQPPPIVVTRDVSRNRPRAPGRGAGRTYGCSAAIDCSAATGCDGTGRLTPCRAGAVSVRRRLRSGCWRPDGAAAHPARPPPRDRGRSSS